MPTDELDLAAEFPGALERGELGFGFQPIVEATTGETVWAEALIRWAHPRRYVGPGEFLPLAERLGLMPSHQWIYETISATARAWRAARSESVITANAPSVLDETLIVVVDALLADGLPPDAMAFEVEWTTLLAGRQLAQDLRSRGLRVGLDDYTPSMSLDELARLPIDFVKLDGSMVRPILGNGDARTSVQTVVGACVDRGLPVVAEFVESLDHAAALVEAGCTLMQGGAYGWPLRHDAFLAASNNRAAIRR